MRRALLIGVAVAACLRAAGHAAADEKVIIFAAASTRAVVEEVGKEFHDETGVEVEVVPGPSSGLARQIVEGAQAHLFLSADKKNADYLEQEKLVAERRDLLTNRLVVVVPADSSVRIESLADLKASAVERIAIGEQRVPAGEYARQALRAADLLEALEPKFIGAVDVKAVVQFVSRGEADVGFVYSTDAQAAAETIRVALEVDPAQHEPIVYPLVLVKQESISAAARKFYEYLASDAAAEAFQRAGFGTMQ
jgi:molybdate transport system substrate-binding protein